MGIEKKLNEWKRKLLDLGKRNALINFKLDAKSVLRLTKPSMAELWNTIVETDSKIEFPYIDENSYEDDEGFLPEYEYGEIFTNRKKKEAQRILRNLRKRAKSISEEQGVNTLYLVFGLLEWTEGDSSKIKLYSPLILVPVFLVRESIKSPIILKTHEDEIVINPTLNYKLEHDFNITLPEFNESNFSENVSALKKFAIENEWKFIDAVCLTHLSFLKINMYKDLERHKGSIMNHAIINAFAGNIDEEKLGPLRQAAQGLEGFDHDGQKPHSVHQVVDADSSQQDAIICADKGISFVLQGPPETGKSQTITNIIASKLADGKKVLFVSEKKAALEVVYKRLKECGLADFILTLHSNKANKKETLEQLATVLALSRNRMSLSDSAQYELDKLVKDRDELNAYAKQVNEKISPLGKSIFYANGIISKYIDIESISFSIPNVRNTSPEKYNEYINVLNGISYSIRKMNDDFPSNPWRNMTVPRYTHEFLHDLEGKKKSISEAADAFAELFRQLKNEIGIVSHKHNIEEAEKIISLLKVSAQSPLIPKAWLEENVVDKIKKHIEEQRALQGDFLQIADTAKQLTQALKNHNAAWNFSETDFYKSGSMQELMSILDNIIESDACYSNLKKDVNKLGLIKNNEQTVLKFNEITKKILAEYNSDLFSIDSKSMEMRYKYNYTSFFKVFNPQYWKDQKLLKQMQTIPNAKKRLVDINALFEDLNRRSELKETLETEQMEMTVLFPLIYKNENTDFELVHKELEKFDTLKKCLEQCNALNKILKQSERKEYELKGLFAENYDGFKTDWNSVNEKLSWFECFSLECHNIGNNTLSEQFVTNTCTHGQFKLTIKKYLSQFECLLNQYKDDFVWFADKFENSKEIIAQSFSVISNQINSCSNSINCLEAWIDYRGFRKDGIALGLAEYLQIIENKPVKSEAVIPAFKKRFFRLWLDFVYEEYPAVARFRHTSHEELIKEFAELDKHQLSIAQARIKMGIINALPDFGAFRSMEVNVLKRELEKQRNIMPIRILFNSIPNLLMRLKPCLMMSPLSVSRYLESDCYQFDTVIFDEASQVKTENAIGAIFRGKQIIIAGDSKQLPPTNFFEVTTSDDEFDSDEDEENEMVDASVLEEAFFLPSKELLWHYRSRHEHLIAFSNSKIYKNRLVTFPSNREKLPDWGVEYIFVENGVYNGKGDPRGNVKEAEQVAQEVFSHIKKHPERTLGVITFGVVQEFAIESAIHRMRQDNLQYEEFFIEDKHEAFFVKSLENVQGDERDTIIFSIGYAKDTAGKMAMRFGPLSTVGGERRLNVAITRAKYNVKLIGSIKPTDIDTERVSQEGPKLLRKYIEFAMTGIEVLQNEAEVADEPQFDSPFENSVFSFLDSQGYKVSTQVGCSGYRIDMAIKHPSLSGIFVLGIECDGATYHSSRTARERDRLRQDVLEAMGWRIYRIWSTDWIKNNAEEKQRLLKAVEYAISTYKSGFYVEQEKTGQEEQNMFVSVTEKTTEADAFEFAEYEEYDIANCDKRYLSLKGLLDMVHLEQPVHFDVICQRFCPLFGYEKVTPTVQNKIKSLLATGCRNFSQANDFYCIKGEEDMYKVRIAGTRQIKYISPEEISKGMVQILNHSIGMTKENLIKDTVRLFGFKRAGSNIGESLDKVFNYLISKKKIYIKECKVYLQTPANHTTY